MPDPQRNPFGGGVAADLRYELRGGRLAILDEACLQFGKDIAN
jgi:hypothetical protein